MGGLAGSFRIVLVAVCVAAAVGAGSGTAGSRPLPGASKCPMFPASSPWNQDVSGWSVASNSATLIGSIGSDATVHPDFGSYAGYGIPYMVVGKSVAHRRVTFEYDDESDHVRYPIPRKPRIEEGSDHHLLVVDRSKCRLYELYDVARSGGRWTAGSGATWNLRSNKLRPDGWTSADAAGLPILPGLVRYDEIAAGRINHAVRFTAPRTRSAHIFPARHDAGEGNDPSLPPMGMRVRLRASFDTSTLPPQARIIARALQTYGMLLADNGTEWYVTGAPDPRWDDDDLRQLDRITGSDFEVVAK